MVNHHVPRSVPGTYSNVPPPSNTDSNRWQPYPQRGRFERVHFIISNEKCNQSRHYIVCINTSRGKSLVTCYQSPIKTNNGATARHCWNVNTSLTPTRLLPSNRSRIIIISTQHNGIGRRPLNFTRNETDVYLTVVVRLLTGFRLARPLHLKEEKILFNETFLL